MDSGIDASVEAGPAASDDAGFDAANDTGTDGPFPLTTDVDGGETSATLTVVLSNQGDDCATCAAKSCLISGQTCEALGTAVATSGPSAGTERSTLCLDTLACLVDSSPDIPCYDVGTFPAVCYCGPSENAAECASNGPAAGAQCGAVELAGLETTDPATAIARFNASETTLGAQMANAIANCLIGPCGDVCLQ
jgi:hypothetical protein